jgi:hypothetical protein
MASGNRLSLKEAAELADTIEQNGGNANSIRSVIAEINDSRNNHDSMPESKMSDEEYINHMRSQSPVENGHDLECMICHGTFDQLLSGTCEVCFREWMLKAKKR